MEKIQYVMDDLHTVKEEKIEGHWQVKKRLKVAAVGPDGSLLILELDKRALEGSPPIL